MVIANVAVTNVALAVTSPSLLMTANAAHALETRGQYLKLIPHLFKGVQGMC